MLNVCMKTSETNLITLTCALFSASINSIWNKKVIVTVNNLPIITVVGDVNYETSRRGTGTRGQFAKMLTRIILHTKPELHCFKLHSKERR